MIILILTMFHMVPIRLGIFMFLIKYYVGRGKEDYANIISRYYAILEF